MVKYMKKYLQFLASLIILLAAGYIFLVHTVMPRYIKQMLPQAEQLAQDYINGSVTIGGLKWEGGLTAELTDVTVKDAQGVKVAELPRTVITMRPWLAMDKAARAVSGIDVQRPKIYLTMNDKEKWNMQNLLKPSDDTETPFYGTLTVHNGELLVTMPQGKWSFGVDGSVNGGANPDFAVDLNVTSGADKLRLNGLVTTKGEGRLQLAGDKLNLAAYAPLAERYADIKGLQGGLGKLALLYVSRQGQTRFSGEVKLDALSGSMTLAGAEHDFKLDGEVLANDNKIKVKSLEAEVDKQRLHFEGSADLQNTDEPSGEGVLTAEKLTYGDYSVGKLRLPFVISKEAVQLRDVSAEYGGGKLTANGSYELANKTLTADVDVQGVKQSLGAADSISASGRLAVLAKLLDEQMELHAAADTLQLQWRSLKINRLALDGSYNAKGLKIDRLSAFAGENGSLAAKGSISPEGELAIRGRMTDFPIDPVLDITAGQKGSGLCSTGFIIGGTLQAPEFASMIQLKQVEFMSQKINEAHGFVGLKNNVLKFKDMRANMEQGYHILNGTVDISGTEPVVDVTLETNGVRIEPLMALIGKQDMLTGNLTNVMNVKGALEHPHIYGEVQATDGSAAKQLFTKVAGRYVYDDGHLELQHFVVDAFYGRLLLDGVMTQDKKLDFAMEATGVDLAHLPIKDETVDLEGKINAKGHLGGTLTKPFFDGNVDSEKILINGEALTELQGTLASNGRETNKLNASFKQPYRDDEVNYGLFSADVNLNFVGRYIEGKVETLWGDIGGLLRMARYDYDISGQMQGQLQFSYAGRGNGVKITASADDVKIHDLNYAHMNFEGRIDKGGVLHFDNVRLQEQDGVTDKGIIAVGGEVDIKQRTLKVELAAMKANPAIVTAVMKNPPEIKGETDMLVQLSGTFDNPEATASLEIAKGSVAGVGIDKLTALLALKDDHIQLQQLIAAKDVYGVTASGDIPLDIFRSQEQRKNPHAQMNIVVDLDNARLGILPAMTKLVEWGVGETKGKIRVAGTLEEPLLYGSVKIADGSVKVKQLNTVMDNINLDVVFNGNMINLKNLSTKLGKGLLKAEGSYALNTSLDSGYSLHIVADKAQLASQLFTGTINGDVLIEPQKYPDFKNHKGSGEPKMLFRPLVKGHVRLDDVLVNMPTVPELDEGESNIGLDMKLELGPKIHLYNSYLYDIWLKGGINIKGSTLFPTIEGTIKADKGKITYLRTDFKLDNAGLVWVEPGSFLPNVSLDSTARFSRYNIFMKINGPVSEMDLQLSSNPPLDKNTIVRMLTLQRDSAGSNEVTSEDMANLMTVGLQMTVLGDVEMLVKQTLGLDQFRIYTGKTRSGIGFESYHDKNTELTADEKNQYNVLVSKYLNNNFMLGYTTSFDGNDRSIFGQYDISKHMNVTYSRTYNLSKDYKDWYGLEYKITF